ncbi:MAG: LysR family transcriptional regulator [Clostridia bacterium]|nr:LysR family transcriptional regulator [Clostridia bacterium]
MDINKLKAFVCVVKWKSFTKAAAELFISQPALSKKISDFEKELGTPLLLRDNRVIKLTPAGRLLFNEAPAYLKLGDDLESKVKESGQNPGHHLSFGCSGIEYGRLQEAICGFRAAHPDISISTRHFSAQTIREQLLANLIDFGFQTHFEVENETEEVDFLSFSHDELAIVMSKDHPLAQEKEISMAQLRNETYIGIQPTSDHMPFTRMINRLCQSGFQPQKIMVADSIDELILCVSCGLGIAHLFAQTRKAHGDLVQYVRMKAPLMKLQIDLVWNRCNNNPAAELFKEYVAKQNRLRKE